MKKGQKHTPESLEKMRLAKLGKTASEETKRKRSESLKGRKLSEETIEKMRLARVGKKPSPETREKMSSAQKGKVMSESFKEKLSARMLGNTYGKGKTRNFSEEHRRKLSEAAKKRKVDRGGNKNPMWLGDKVGYSGIHIWIAKELGKPALCEHCGTTDAPMYDWANKTGKYLRDISDWLRLCRSCHMKYDKNGFKALDIEYQGKTQGLKAWARDHGIKYITLYRRVKVLNWPIDKALNTPVGG